jgi:hypothetical protein
LTVDLYKLKEIHKALCKNVFKYLGDVRNNSGAHKEQNSIVLSEKIKTIDYGVIKADSIMCFILFMVILQFQNNVLHSLTTMYNQDPSTSIPIKNTVKYVKVENRFKEVMMLVYGTDPSIAEWLSKLSKEEITKTQILLEKLRNLIN